MAACMNYEPKIDYYVKSTFRGCWWSRFP